MGMVSDRFGIVGKVIARTYEIREVVAEGGFGVVYRAYHQGFRAEVALKCLKIPTELTSDQRRYFLEQFRSEAEVLFRLSSHNGNIVRPLHVDAFHTSDERLVPFMAMEWLEGKTLDGLMMQRAEQGRPPISLPKLVRLLTPVAAALEVAHNLPGKDGPEIVVHRDMKPENLFIARIGQQDVAKILDFGISKVKSTASQMVGRASLQADSLVSFSPAYGAPEQWAPRRFGQTGRWTDVWGLALTVVEVAKGNEVIVGDHAEMMGTILDPGRRPTPRNEGLDVSEQVEGVFERALAVDPKKRFQTVAAFWDGLTSSLGIQSEVGGPLSLHLRPIRRAVTTDFDAPPLSEPGGDALVLSVAPGARAQKASPPTVQGASAGAYDSEQVQVGAALRALPSSLPESAAGFGGGMQSVRSQARPRPLMVSRAPVGRESMLKALGPALSLVALSVAFTLLDRAFAHSRGIPLSIGPIRVSWVAGGVMVLAILAAVGAIRRQWED
jgi:serine/threonine protein kinase